MNDVRSRSVSSSKATVIIGSVAILILFFTAPHTAVHDSDSLSMPQSSQASEFIQCSHVFSQDFDTRLKHPDYTVDDYVWCERPESSCIDTDMSMCKMYANTQDTIFVHAPSSYRCYRNACLTLVHTSGESIYWDQFPQRGSIASCEGFLCAGANTIDHRPSQMAQVMVEPFSDEASSSATNGITSLDIRIPLQGLSFKQYWYYLADSDTPVDLSYQDRLDRFHAYIVNDLIDSLRVGGVRIDSERVQDVRIDYDQSVYYVAFRVPFSLDDVTSVAFDAHPNDLIPAHYADGYYEARDIAPTQVDTAVYETRIFPSVMRLTFKKPLDLRARFFVMRLYTTRRAHEGYVFSDARYTIANNIESIDVRSGSERIMRTWEGDMPTALYVVDRIDPITLEQMDIMRVRDVSDAYIFADVDTAIRMFTYVPEGIPLRGSLPDPHQDQGASQWHVVDLVYYFSTDQEAQNQYNAVMWATNSSVDQDNMPDGIATSPFVSKAFPVVPVAYRYFDKTKQREAIVLQTLTDGNMMHTTGERPYTHYRTYMHIFETVR